MKYLIYILLFVGLASVAKAQVPFGVPTQKINGWIENWYTVPDSGNVLTKRDTNFIPRFVGTTVTKQQAGVDTSVWFYNGARWRQLGIGNLTADNGLTRIGNNLQQGGALVKNTDIDNVGFNYFLHGTGQNILRTQNGTFQSNITTSNISGQLTANNTNNNLFSEINAVEGSAYLVGGKNGVFYNEIHADSDRVFLITKSNTAPKRAILDTFGYFSLDAYPSLTQETDTSIYKPVAINSSGKLVPFSKWPAAGGGGSGLTSVGLSMPSAFTVTNSPLTVNGTIAITGAGTSLQYIRGNGTLATFDTGAIPNFYLKVRGLITGTSPITFNQTTGAIGINNANTSGTKGAASFTGSFSDNGSGQIDLLSLVTSGSCTSCNVTFDAKGRATAFANGSGGSGSITNAAGTGDTLLISNTIKRLNPGYGINHIATSTNITQSVDTFELAQKWGLEDLIWKRKGPVSGLSVTGDSLQEPTVIREGNPQILTGETTVFKIWYTQGWNTVGIWYAESVDGRNWVRYSGNPVISNHSRSCVIKDGSTYICYTVPGVTGPQIDRYTSTDGVTFTLANAAVVTQGTVGEWNDGGIFNSWVIKDGATWKMLVDGLSNTTNQYADGYYESSDGITWTQPATNPVTYLTGPYFKKIGATFWLWGHAGPDGPFILPTDAFRGHSTDMVNWVYDPIPYNSTFHRMTEDEGVDSVKGQVADLNLVEVGDSVYMFYSATPNGDAPGDGINKGLIIKLAVAEMPITTLVTTRENADRFNSFETGGHNLYYNMGNVGFGKVRPKYPIDVLTIAKTNTGFVSYSDPSDGGSGPSDGMAVGYNLYHRATAPIWRLVDTTNHGMSFVIGVNDIQIMSTIGINTSSPTVYTYGRFKRQDSTFNWLGRTILGNGTVDDGVTALNVNGPFKLNGNATFLGTINLLKIDRGGGSIATNVRIGDASTLPSNTTGQQVTAIGSQAAQSNTTGSYGTYIGAFAGNSNVSGDFNTTIGNLAAFSNTGSNVTAVGRATLYSATGDGNTGLGVGAGRSITTASNNLALGLNAFYTDGTTASTNVSGSAAIGYNAQVTQSNSGVLGGIDANGFGMRWTVGLTAPSAWFHLRGGKTNAGFASLKIDSGALLTTPEKYAIEVTGDSIYWTNNASERIALNRIGSGASQTWQQSLTTGSTLIGNNTVTGGNNSFTFNGMFNYRVNANSFILDKSTPVSPYSFTVIGADNRFQLGYTPTPATYSKGAGIVIDTNNNVSLGSQIPTTAPLYASGVSAFVNGIQNQAGNFYSVDAITSNVTAGLTDYYFRIDATSGNITITLPAASTAFGASMGLVYIFKRIDNSGNTVNVVRAGSDTIDGATSFTLGTQWEVKELIASSSSTWDLK
jgi:hypothetical protein